MYNVNVIPLFAILKNVTHVVNFLLVSFYNICNVFENSLRTIKVSWLNYLCYYMRNTVEESMDEFRGDLNSIYLMGTTNIKSFLVRKNKLLLITKL